MPCFDAQSHHEKEVVKVERDVLSSFVCGMFKGMTFNQMAEVMNRIDWTQAGISPKQVVKWYMEHHKCEESDSSWCLPDIEKFRTPTDFTRKVRIDDILQWAME